MSATDPHDASTPAPLPGDAAALAARFVHDLRAPLAGLMSLDADIERLTPAAREIFYDVVARLQALEQRYAGP